MNQTIWKFAISFEKKVVIKMPKESEILCVQKDKTNMPCIWVLVYPENETEERVFELFGDESNIRNDIGISRKYIGTYQYQKGEFIGHVFERL